MKLRNALVGIFVWSAVATAGHAATLTVNGDGQATGATGVSVSGTVYDVSFVEGNCDDLFSGCDEASDFTLNTNTEALAAAQALSDLFNATGNEGFTAAPITTLGCERNACTIYTPFDNTRTANGDRNTNGVQISGFVNLTSTDAVFSTTNPFSGGLLDSYNTASDENTVYARWVEAGPLAAVPVPASLPMLAAGLFGFAALGRRKRIAK